MRMSKAVWLSCGVLIALLLAGIALISPEFGFDIPALEKPVIPLVIMLCAAGFFYLVAVRSGAEFDMNPRSFVFLLLIGAIMRGAMFFSEPILEDDFYRYLWDGAVTANGLSPYEYSPRQVWVGGANVPDRLGKLAGEWGVARERINHPELKTIYPPVAQGIFAAAYAISPWEIRGLRFIYIIFDVLTLSVLALALVRLGLPLAFLTIYWWNPLLVKEIYNSLHMDIAALPLVAGGLYVASQRRHVSGIFQLVIAIGIKLWPLALLPAIFRELVGSLRRLILLLAALCLGFIVLFAPLYLSGLESDAGIVAYLRSWENNDSAFKLLLWSVEFFLRLLHIHPGHGQFVARLTLPFLVGVWIFYVLRKPALEPGGLFDRGVLIVGGLFLIIPTQFPWYYVWLIPMLPLSPRMPFLILTMLLPLYYLGYYFAPRGGDFYREYIIPWAEFLPAWVLIAREWLAYRRSRHKAVQSIH